MKSVHHGLAAWMLPNVVALDAPLVALTWQWFLAQQFCVPVSWQSATVLASATWAVYLFDRRADAGGSGDAAAAYTARHTFAARHQRWFGWLAAAAAVVAFGLAPWTPAPLLWPGLALGAAVLGYLHAVHRRRAASLRTAGAKETLVAVCFAAGTSLLLLGVQHERAVAAAASAVLFGNACWCNCRLIDVWEGGPRLRWWELGISLAIGSVCSAWAPAAVVGVAWTMVALFVAVHFGVSQRNRELARCLVDVAMIVPVVVWAVA